MPVIRQLLHQVVVVVALTKADHAQKNATLAFFFHQLLQIFNAGGADIKVTIGCQDDSVNAVF